MNKLKKIFEKVFWTITFVLIPIIFFTIITSKTSAFLGFQSFTVLSGSMSPTIPTGSIVYIQKSDRFEKGEIITFKKNELNITHRVVEITDKNGKPASALVSPLPGAPNPGEIFYKVKGDANSSPDTDLVASKEIIGKTFISIPAVGRLTNFLKTVPGFLLFIVGPTLIFISFELWNIKKEIERQTEKRVLERLSLA